MKCSAIKASGASSPQDGQAEIVDSEFALTIDSFTAVDVEERPWVMLCGLDSVLGRAVRVLVGFAVFLRLVAVGTGVALLRGVLAGILVLFPRLWTMTRPAAVPASIPIRNCRMVGSNLLVPLRQWYIQVGFPGAVVADYSSPRCSLHVVEVQNLPPAGGTDKDAKAHAPRPSRSKLYAHR